MESFFPELFFLSYLAPVILRAALAVLFLFDARKLLKTGKKKYLGIASALVGLLIAVGLFTQLAVIAAALVALYAFQRAKQESVFGTRATILLTLAILIFLFIAGPGGVAFDLPY